jgi:general secretion pathway protein L
MSKLVGIDIRPNLVRVAVIRTSYRRLHLESVREVSAAGFDEQEHVLRHAAGEFTRHGEQVAITIGGQSAYIHRLALPPAALKQVDDVVPFELEARVPVDFENLVFDSRVLPRSRTDAAVEVLAAAAPIDLIRERIALAKGALNHEPEVISLAPLSLGNLAAAYPSLRGNECVAVVELAESTCEICILQRGIPVFGRTLSVGVAGFPESASELARALRQTWVSWAATNQDVVVRAFLCGGGSMLPGIDEFLSTGSDIPYTLLAGCDLQGLTPDVAAQLPAFSRAIGVALALRAGSKDLNLRRGSLTYQRGYGFMKEKVPLFAGLGGAILVSFVFSAWAESRGLEQQNASLTEAMAGLSKQLLEEESTDAAYVAELLDKGLRKEKDPQPDTDAFKLVLQLAKHIPLEFEHEVDELDLARGHVKLRGIVKSTEAAQKIAENLKTEPCFKDVKILKISQHQKSERQAYSMEFEIRCEELPKKKPAASAEEPQP